MIPQQSLFALLALFVGVQATPITKKMGRRCSYTISSYDDVADAVSSACTTLSMGGFSVPSGETLDLSDIADGTTVTLTGDITFESGTDWSGPLFKIKGEDITLDGAGYTFDGNGADYWDGEGSNGGVTKPKMTSIEMGGTITNLILLNTPVQAMSISNDYALTIDGVTINNKAGDDTDSDGDALGHNTDCFDVSGSDVLITNSFCYNQDDCLAINSGTNITFSNNYCSGGHGISIGSIASDKVVETVVISGNTVVDSENGLRIKTDSGATGGSVSDVTYSDNTVSGCTDYGVVIEQDYENGSPTGTPTDGIPITSVTFTGTNTVQVVSGAEEIYLLCASGACSDFDFSGLCVSGGDEGTITGVTVSGFTLGDDSTCSGSTNNPSAATATTYATETATASSTSTDDDSTDPTSALTAVSTAMTDASTAVTDAATSVTDLTTSVTGVATALTAATTVSTGSASVTVTVIATDSTSAATDISTAATSPVTEVTTDSTTGDITSLATGGATGTTPDSVPIITDTVSATDVTVNATATATETSSTSTSSVYHRHSHGF